MGSQREEARGPPGNSNLMEGKLLDRMVQTRSLDAGPSNTTTQINELSTQNRYQVNVSLASKMETSEAQADTTEASAAPGSCSRRKEVRGNLNTRGPERVVLRVSDLGG